MAFQAWECQNHVLIDDIILINGIKTKTYHQWLEITILPSLIGLPVISIPNNKSNSKSVLATQIVGAKNTEKELLELALEIFNSMEK